MKNLIALVVGIIFAIGLGTSGMTQMHVVRGFLDITGNWNPNLIGVMIGAIGVHSILYYFIKKRSSPLLDTQFHIPSKKDLDKRLLLGASIFGLGWGIVGICPGPGIVALVSGHLGIFIFIVSMLIGMGLFQAIESRMK